MNDELFIELLENIREDGRILHRKETTSHTFYRETPEVQRVERLSIKSTTAHETARI